MAMVDPHTDEAKGLVFLGLEAAGRHCRLGYWVIPQARRKGFASNSVALVSRWVLTKTDVSRLIAHVEPSNEASLATLRGNGFIEEGIARSYIVVDDGTLDAIQFSLLRTDV
jgi:ribosomal-protein-alanine N-acetyltransferase